jgi:uncharacterized protein (DUF427 family)
MASEETPRVEESAKRVRVMSSGRVVADSRRPLLVWEIPYYPTYYFPDPDVTPGALIETGRRDGKIEYAVEAGGHRVEAGAYRMLTPGYPADAVAFVWDAMDHWFEEDEEVFVHPRDPYKRIDILSSSRRVRVEVGGVTVADTTNAMFLFETGLPVRYYIPKTDVRMDLLTPTDTSTACPYKGFARYWSVTVGGRTYPDVVWGYDTPLPESQKIAGRVAFYNEKVDIYVDEEPMERPTTKFS